MIRLLISVLGLILFTQSAVSQSSRRPFPGTRYQIQLPDSFVQADRFVGFQSRSGGVSLSTSTVPTGIGRSLQSLDSGRVKTQGVLMISKEEIDAPDGRRYLIKMQQKVKNKPYIKYMLLIGDSSSTRIFSCFVPEGDATMNILIPEALKGLQYDSTLVTNPWDAVNFAMNLEDTDLKFVLNNAGGIIFTNDGKYPSRSDKHLTLVAGLSVKGFSPHSKLDIAKNRLQAMKMADSLQIEKTDSVVIDELSGYELVAYGINKKKEKELVFMVMLFESDQRYYLLNFTTNHDFAKHLAMFRKTVKTFKRKH